jgi:acyl dehydratase
MTERKTAEQLYTGTHALSDAQVGDKLGSLDFVITAEQVERNAWANDDYNPWYMDDSPFGGRIISPVYLASFDARLFYGYYSYPPGGSLFAKQEFDYLVPLRIGVPYTMTGTLIDIYRRRGRTFFVAGMSVTDPDGTEVMRMSKTVATPVRPAAEPSGTPNAAPAPVQEQR